MPFLSLLSRAALDRPHTNNGMSSAYAFKVKLSPIHRKRDSKRANDRKDTCRQSLEK